MYVNKKIEEASTIDSSFYTSKNVFLESKKIFENSWQYVTHDASLVKKNAFPFFYVDEYINEPLLLFRDSKSQLNCFSNVCTHRGSILVEEHSQLKDNFSCRYHGRKFNSKGRCVFMPKFENVQGFPSKSDNLTNISFEKWRQFIFSSLGNKYQLKQFFSNMENRIGWMPIDKFKYNSELSKDYFVNAHWALYCDNYLEGFHIPFVHHDLAKQFEYNEYSVELFPFSNLQLGIGKKEEVCFDLPKDSIDYGKNIIAYYFWIFPNMMFNFYPWGLSLNIIKPVSVNLTKIEFRSFVWDEEKLKSGAGSDLDKVEKEDEEIVELVQKGVNSRFYNKGRFSPSMETGVHHFHTLISDFMK